MKVVNVQGRKKTGKTTTVTNIIAELCRRGYSVGSIKGIHIDGFTMDAEGEDTDKHKKAGANPVTARCHDETDIMFTHKMDLREILKHYDNDWVVIESHVDLNCPNVITGRTAEYSGEGKNESLAEQINSLTVACSGVISNDIDEYRGLPVINPVTDIERLVDVIEDSYANAEGNVSDLKNVDWNGMWQKRDDFMAQNNKSEYWDGRAASFRKKRSAEDDPYTETFYEYMEIEEGETIFDMGCGSGTLAIPFAKKGHEVWAADFSEEMLRRLMTDAGEEGVADRIHPIVLDWNEDWSLRELPKCDYAIASRSLIFEDLTSSLKKLESVATKRCCLGAWDGPFTGYDRYVARAIGFERPGYGCHYIVMNELMDRDVYPEMKYIFTPFRKDSFESYEEGWKKLHDSFNGKLSEEQEKLFDEYCREHFVKIEKAAENGDRYWQMNHGNMSTVAFISWNIKTVFDE